MGKIKKKMLRKRKNMLRKRKKRKKEVMKTKTSKIGTKMERRVKNTAKARTRMRNVRGWNKGRRGGHPLHRVHLEVDKVFSNTRGHRSTGKFHEACCSAESCKDLSTRESLKPKVVNGDSKGC